MLLALTANFQIGRQNSNLAAQPTWLQSSLAPITKIQRNLSKQKYPNRAKFENSNKFRKFSNFSMKNVKRVKSGYNLKKKVTIERTMSCCYRRVGRRSRLTRRPSPPTSPPSCWPPTATTTRSSKSCWTGAEPCPCPTTSDAAVKNA